MWFSEDKTILWLWVQLHVCCHYPEIYLLLEKCVIRYKTGMLFFTIVFCNFHYNFHYIPKSCVYIYYTLLTEIRLWQMCVSDHREYPCWFSGHFGQKRFCSFRVLRYVTQSWYQQFVWWILRVKILFVVWSAFRKWLHFTWRLGLKNRFDWGNPTDHFCFVMTLFPCE